MADAMLLNVALSNFLLNSPGNKEEYTCGRCRYRETQLKEALNELRSARTIISILLVHLSQSLYDHVYSKSASCR